jgi:flagellar biosynthesis/type III secretory pathway protein FliH
MNREFHGSRIEPEGITMDFKKFIADLAAMYRKPTERTPVGPVMDVDAVHEAGRRAGHDAGHAEGYEAGRKAGYEDGRIDWYEAGYNKGYDEGFQMGLEAKTPPEAPAPPEPQPEPPPPKLEP